MQSTPGPLVSLNIVWILVMSHHLCPYTAAAPKLVTILREYRLFTLSTVQLSCAQIVPHWNTLLARISA